MTKKNCQKKCKNASFLIPLQTLLCFVLLAGVMQGCAVPLRNPVPEVLTTTVHPLQLDSIRIFIEPGSFQHEDFFSDSLSTLFKRYSNSEQMLTLLALSGGSEGGAFGAGFLNGWSDYGNRPVFDVVTGVSTGALMAPFAFLGEESDENLKAVYTTVSADNIFVLRGLLEMLTTRDALANNHPLAQLLEQYVSDEVIARIGREQIKGRRLYVGTTHLDSGRLVVWDMGAIALSNHVEATDLFRNVLLASASIPIAFPPVYIPIAIGGDKYDEMHVDGAVVNQVFGTETLVHLLTAHNKSKEKIQARIFMILNSDLSTDWQPVSRKLIDIGNRAVDVMINSQSMGDIIRNYFLADRAGIEFHITGIPDSFRKKSPEPFDTKYMNTLFDVGYQKGRSTDQWEENPFLR